MEATTRGGNSILGFKGTRPGARVGAAMFQVRGFGRPKFSRVVLLLCLSGFSLIRMFEAVLCSCFVYLVFFSRIRMFEAVMFASSICFYGDSDVRSSRVLLLLRLSVLFKDSDFRNVLCFPCFVYQILDYDMVYIPYLCSVWEELALCSRGRGVEFVFFRAFCVCLSFFSCVGCPVYFS